MDCAGYVESGIYALSETIGNYDESHMHGYGHEFENTVFEMHPYYWGDCECGYEESEEEWCDLHFHADDCYQTELKRRGNDDYDNGMDYDTRAKIAPDLAREWGLSYYGCAVHCTCEYEKAWEDWSGVHHHEPTCRVVLPNFRHKATGFSVHWYKYMGRGQTMSGKMDAKQWRTILRECEDSLV